MDDVFSNVFIKEGCPCMNSCTYHRIRDSVVKLYAYVVHAILSLVIEVTLDTQLRLMCKWADDSVLLVMGMVMLIRLTRTQLKCLASRTDPQ
jgi:uncharacterized membrane protein